MSSDEPLFITYKHPTGEWWVIHVDIYGSRTLVSGGRHVTEADAADHVARLYSERIADDAR